MKAVSLGLLLASLAPLAPLLAADAVGEASQDATRGWQNAPAEMKSLPPEFRAQLDNLPPESQRPAIEPLLGELLSVGLATKERTGPDDENPDLSCHELVREPIRHWMAEQSRDRGEWTENAIRLAYAERLAAVFRALQHQNMTLALESRSRAVVYCVQAAAWDRLGDVAIRASRHARAAANVGGEDARQAWWDLAWITGNWADAFRNVGDLNAARQRQLEAADAYKQAGNPAINVIGSELEALRIEVMQGNLAAALPQIETRLAQVAARWQRHRTGQSVPEAPDAEDLARAYISALDVATTADIAREDWESALGRLDTVLEVKRALQRPAVDIGVTRCNRATVQVELPGRFGEARSELEACVQLLQHNPPMSAKVLISLANLFSRQGDVAQAITQARRALAASPRHQLAALIYRLVAGLGQYLPTSRHNYAIDFRRARAAGTEPTVPCVADRLADPAFHPLAQWLRQRQVPLGDLQSAVDQFLAQARQLSDENQPQRTGSDTE